MSKGDLSERDICTKFITPALVGAGWDVHSQVREEVGFTKGRIIVRGKLVTRGKAKRADYVLFPACGSSFSTSRSYLARALWLDRTSGRLRQFFTGTGIKHLTGKGLARYSFALPPLAEQRRIVAKVDQLMALCDRLEAAQAERERRRDRLAAASLHRLNHGADTDRREYVRFHLHHLPRLTTHRESINECRQTIFNLAVCGKLVPPDPNDEPASQLLKRIKADSDAQMIGQKELEPSGGPGAIRHSCGLGMGPLWPIDRCCRFRMEPALRELPGLGRQLGSYQGECRFLGSFSA